MTDGHPSKVTKLLRALVPLSVVLAAFALSAFPIRNFDLWHHMTIGGYIVEHRCVPANDLFSFASRGPWVNPAWLAGVIFYLLFHAGGPAAVVLFKASAAAAAVGLLVRTAIKDGASPAVTALAALAVVYPMRVRLICRPLIFSTLLLAVTVAILRDFAARRGNRLWLLPLLSALWANLHAGFFAAWALMPIYLLGELRRPDDAKAKPARVRSLVAWGALCAPAALLNPFGYRVLVLPFTLTDSSQLSLTAEWRPMALGLHFFTPGSPTFLHDFALFWIALALLALCLAVTIKRVTLTDGLTVLLFGAMALSARRHVDLFGVAVLPVFAKHATLALEPLKRFVRWPRLGNAALAIGIVAAGLWLRAPNDPRRLGLGVDESRYPVAAADFIQANRLSGRMLNYWSWGPYLIWRFFPERKVFADGRFEAYEPKVFVDWLVMNEGRPGWEKLADEYKINFTVIAPSPRHAGQFRSPRWKLIYWDDLCVIFIRNAPANRALIGRFDCELTHPVTFLANLQQPENVPIMEAQLRAKLATAPRCAKAHGNLAKLLLHTGRVAEAAAEFKQLVRLRPWSPSAQHDLGMCCLRLGRVDAALAAFEAVLDMPAPGNLHGLACLRAGDCWLRKGDRRRAAKCYRKALKLLPGNEDAQAGLEAARGPSP